MPTEKTASTLIPGEILPAEGEVVLNAGRPVQSVPVLNTGDRPIQVGSHYHFFEANRALRFPRATTFGLRLDIPAGTAVRFEPGEEKGRTTGPVRRTTDGLRPERSDRGQYAGGKRPTAGAPKGVGAGLSVFWRGDRGMKYDGLC